VNKRPDLVVYRNVPRTFQFQVRDNAGDTYILPMDAELTFHGDFPWPVASLSYEDDIITVAVNADIPPGNYPYQIFVSTDDFDLALADGFLRVLHVLQEA
jgi:hypothetical protein